MKDKNDKNGEEEDEVKEVDHHNSFKAEYWLGTDEMNELKRELKDLKTSLKWKQFALKCSTLFKCIFMLCYINFNGLPSPHL